MDAILPSILSLAVSFIAVCIIHPQLVKIALRKQIVDCPNERKLQKSPVPTMGGIAVFFGIATGMTSVGFMADCSALFTVLIALLVMLYLGTIDDMLDVPPLVRFTVQIITVAMLIFIGGYSLDDLHGLWGVGEIPLAASLPLTLFAVVGIINAMNLIDGVDGLSSGLCILYCTIFGIVCLLAGDTEMTVMCVSAIGALVPFFMHNAFGLTSKMFIGNGGTMLMGIMLSVIVMSMVSETKFRPLFDADGYSVVAFTLAVLSVPVFDTLRVMFSRMLRGTSPFMADKTHLHHMFIHWGYSHIGTTLRMIALNILVVGVWAASAYLGASADVQFYIVIAAGVLATSGLYETAAAVERRFPERSARFIDHNFRTKPKRDGIFLFLRKLMDNL